jgi:hypothetical protein
MPPLNGSLPVHPLPSLQQRGLTGYWFPFVDDHLLRPVGVFGVALETEDVLTVGILDPAVGHYQGFLLVQAYLLIARPWRWFDKFCDCLLLFLTSVSTSVCFIESD